MNSVFNATSEFTTALKFSMDNKTVFYHEEAATRKNEATRGN
jgi:hypothetical protein